MKVRGVLTFDNLVIRKSLQADARLGRRGPESKQLFDLVGWTSSRVGGRHVRVVGTLGDQGVTEIVWS